MNCPSCGAQTLVKDSRPGSVGHRRRRRCENCGKRFTTYEILVPLHGAVVLRRGNKHHTRVVLKKIAPDIELYRLVDPDRLACGYCFGFGDGRCPVCDYKGEP